LTVRLEPASSFALSELAAVFTAAYSDYFVPMQVDEQALRTMVSTFDVRLDESRVAVLDGGLVGFANLAVRGEAAWIAGVGVVPECRRSGTGRELMRALLDRAATLGVREVRLEVIEANEAALQLYLQLGFSITRWLEIWSLPLAGGSGAGAARPVDVGAAHERIRALRSSPEPWQRADGTVAHYRTLDPPPFAVEVDGGAALARMAGETVQLLQIGGDAGACRELLETLRAHGPVSVLNLPADHPAADALRAFGIEPSLRQREMVLSL
jgi:GNAT superfamily N-acetyltransferase